MLVFSSQQCSKSVLVQALLFVSALNLSSQHWFTDISLLYHCWLQWALSRFTFTRTQKTAFLMGKPGMLGFLSTLGEVAREKDVDDVERAKDVQLYDLAWKQKIPESGN